MAAPSALPAVSIKTEAISSSETASVPVSTSSKPTTLQLADRQALLDIILADHIYAKPYSLHPDANRIAPAKVLQFSKKKPVSNKGKETSGDGELDVVTFKAQGQLNVSYDSGKSRNVMSEMEKLMDGFSDDGSINEEDEQFVRVGWTKIQGKLFDKIYGILSTYLLARKAYHLNPNEPVLRRIALDKAASRVRHAFSRVLWDTKVTAWLHGVLVDGLHSSMFLCYLEILQTLKSKVPSLIENILNNSAYISTRKDVMASTSLSASLRKSWDPSLGLSTRLRQLKFPQPPFFIMVPCGPNLSTASSKRSRFWHSQLSTYGKVIPVNMHTTGSRSEIDTKHYLEHLIGAVRSKVCEFRTHYSDRPIVLIGWSIGALVACKVSSLEKVSALVCLGFPCIGANDERELENDPLASVTCPTMFVIGSHDLSTSVARVEELRKKLKANNRLLIVPSADSMLKISSSRKKQLQMTQSMLDRLIQDEINLFLMNTFCPEPSPRNDPQAGRSSPSPSRLAIEKRKKKKNAASPSTADGVPTKRKKKVPSSAAESQAAVKVSPGSPASTTASTRTTADSSLSLATLLKMPPGSKPSNGAVKSTGSEAKANSGKAAAKRQLANKSSTDRHAKKPKLSMKKPIATTTASSTVVSRPYSGASFVASSQPGMITLQGFSSGSILLSSAGGQMRLQQGGNVLYVPSTSGVAATTLHAGFRAVQGGTLHPSSSSGTVVMSKSPTVLSYQVTGQRVTAVESSSATSGTKQLTTSGAAEKPGKAPGVTAALPFVRGGSSAAGQAPTKLTQGAVQLAATVSAAGQTAATTTVTTHLSHADLQYLANLLSKQQQQQKQQQLIAGSPVLTATPVVSRAAQQPSNAKKTSPVGLSTKISIGTLTNLNAASSLSSTKAKDGDKANDGRGGAMKSPTLLKLPSHSAPGSPTVISAATATVHATSPSVKGTTSSGVQHIPVTLTIPLSSLTGGSLSLAVGNNNNSTAVTSSGQRTLTLSQSNALSALLAQQKLLLSTSNKPVTYAVPSSLSRAQTQVPAGSCRATASSSDAQLSARVISSQIHRSASSPAVVSSAAVTPIGSNQGQSVTIGETKSPATVTLRFPPQRLLSESQVRVSSTGQEIKVIGVVNRPNAQAAAAHSNSASIRQTQSAPVSPATTVPSTPLSGRSTPVGLVGSDVSMNAKITAPKPSLDASPAPTRKADAVNRPIDANTSSNPLIAHSNNAIHSLSKATNNIRSNEIALTKKEE